MADVADSMNNQLDVIVKMGDAELVVTNDRERAVDKFALLYVPDDFSSGDGGVNSVYLTRDELTNVRDRIDTYLEMHPEEAPGGVLYINDNDGDLWRRNMVYDDKWECVTTVGLHGRSYAELKNNYGPLTLLGALS